MPAGGLDWDDVLDTIQNYVVAGSGLSAQKVAWGDQDIARPEAPAIILRISNLSELGSTWIDMEPNPHTFADITVTANAGTDAFTAVAHARLTGDGPVRLDGADLPLNTDNATDYWVIKLTNNTFQLATTFQNAAALVPVVIDLADAGSGTIKLVDTADTVRRGEELAATARGMLRATVEIRCHSDEGAGVNMPVAILQRVRMRRDLPSQQALLETANITLQDVERIRSYVTGRRDDFLFEPFAQLDVHICMAVEEAEYLTIIERVTGTNEILDPDVDFAIPE